MAALARGACLFSSAALSRLALLLEQGVVAAAARGALRACEGVFGVCSATWTSLKWWGRG